MTGHPTWATRSRAAATRQFAIACLTSGGILLASSAAFSADQFGTVTFSGVPVPGATVTATQGTTELSTVTDVDGAYRIANMPDGVWSIRVEMLGFSTASREVTLPSDGPE